MDPTNKSIMLMAQEQLIHQFEKVSTIPDKYHFNVSITNWGKVTGTVKSCLQYGL